MADKRVWFAFLVDGKILLLHSEVLEHCSKSTL